MNKQFFFLGIIALSWLIQSPSAAYSRQSVIDKTINFLTGNCFRKALLTSIVQGQKYGYAEFKQDVNLHRIDMCEEFKKTMKHHEVTGAVKEGVAQARNLVFQELKKATQKNENNE